MKKINPMYFGKGGPGGTISGPVDRGAIPVASLNVNINDLPDVECVCGGSVFIMGSKLKKLSAVLSPDGVPKYIPMPVQICVLCSAPLPSKP